MNEQYIVLEDMKDWKPYYPSDRIITANEYLMSSGKETIGNMHVINLCRSYGYLDLGWYVSLLAESRRHKVIPDTTAILNISNRSIYSLELDDINNTVDRILKNEHDKHKNEGADFTTFSVRFFFGQTDLTAFSSLARQMYDMFAIPILEVEFKKRDKWIIVKIAPVPLKSLLPFEEDQFVKYLQKFSSQIWHSRKTRHHSRYDFAILHNPDDPYPPSGKRSLQKFVKVGRDLGIQVDLIKKSDFSRLAEYDALLIRETTSVENHTYVFAKKAEAEGMAVIDDPKSILRCTNKIYLANLLDTHNVPHPRTVFVTKESYQKNPDIFDQLGYPFVIKIPDGSFSRGMTKVESRAQLPSVVTTYFKQSDLILAQEFVYTPYDWRIGVLNNKPLFACQYFMSKGHWQIYNHTGAKSKYGESRTCPIMEVPKAVVSIALKASSLIGDGLYGVDVKDTERGPLIVEVNDNPNIDAGWEDGFLGDDLFKIIFEDLMRRLEIKHQHRR